MPTKDPHIAVIDAQEKLHMVRVAVNAATALIKRKARAGQPLTDDEKQQIKLIKAMAIVQTKRIQEEFYEEIESHGTLN